MKKIKNEKRKNIALIIVSIMLIGIGYVNYSYEPLVENEKMSVEENIEKEDENIGDVQLVNADVEQEENVKEEDQYFSQTRLDRENMYSQMVETYQNMVNSEQITSEQKSIAIQEINNITKTKNAIMISENLIKNKGFEDVIILVSNNTASIIIKASELNQEQISQIQNIACRELGIEVSNITITKR